MISLIRRLLGKPRPPAVRPAQVMRLINLGMRETDALDRLQPGHGGADEEAFERAQREYYAALAESTPAEKHAALDALRRHGY